MRRVAIVLLACVAGTLAATSADSSAIYPDCT